MIVPKEGREAVMSLLHEGHPGVTRMKQLARGYVWWPGIDKELEFAVKTCAACQENQIFPAKAPMHPWEWPDRSWARVHVDYAGPVKGKMILVIVDAHSKWIRAHTVSAATSQATIDKLQLVFATHGLPEVIVSDNWSYFTTEEFSTFVRNNGIKHLTSAPYHPASNGLVERAVQTLKNALKKDSSGASLETQTSRFLFHYRITPHSTTGVPPSELLLGRRPRCRLDLLHPDISRKVWEKQAGQKEEHDGNGQERRLSTGQLVWVKNHAAGTPWLPGAIAEVLTCQRYCISLEDGRSVVRHLDHIRSRVVKPGSVCPAVSAEPVFHDPDDNAAPVDAAESPAPTLRRSTRDRHPPERLM